MKTITSLVFQKKDKNKVNVYLDGIYSFALSTEIVLKHNLKKNMVVDEKVLENLQFESEKKLAYEKVLKLISTRYKTQKEVERYMFEKGYMSDTVFYVVKKLIEYNFIDDERYCDSYVAHHIQKDGVIKIKQQLFSKGVSESLINNAINKVDDQTESIILKAKKYMNGKEETKENYAKLYRYLIGKGYRTDEVLKVLKGDIDL